MIGIYTKKVLFSVFQSLRALAIIISHLLCACIFDPPRPKQNKQQTYILTNLYGFRYIKHIFEQLEEFRAFEMLRSGLDRSRYLLVKEAKIIAMTCTHAALKRKELVELGKSWVPYFPQRDVKLKCFQYLYLSAFFFLLLTRAKLDLILYTKVWNLN